MAIATVSIQVSPGTFLFFFLHRRVNHRTRGMVRHPHRRGRGSVKRQAHHLPIYLCIPRGRARCDERGLRVEHGVRRVVIAEGGAS